MGEWVGTGVEWIFGPESIIGGKGVGGLVLR